LGFDNNLQITEQGHEDIVSFLIMSGFDLNELISTDSMVYYPSNKRKKERKKKL